MVLVWIILFLCCSKKLPTYYFLLMHSARHRHHYCCSRKSNIIVEYLTIFVRLNCYLVRIPCLFIYLYSCNKKSNNCNGTVDLYQYSIDSAWIGTYIHMCLLQYLYDHTYSYSVLSLTKFHGRILMIFFGYA